MDWLTNISAAQAEQDAIERSSREVEFLRRFPPHQLGPSEVLPPLNWAQLARQLRSLSLASDDRICWELEALRSGSRTSPPELFLRDLLALAWSLIDESPADAHAESDPGI